MSRPRLQSLLLLAVVVVAFGTVAATVDSGTLSEGDAEPTVPEEEPPLPELPDEAPGGSLCPEPIQEPTGFAAFAAIVVVLGGFLSYRRPAAVPLAIAAGAPLVLGAGACASLFDGLAGSGGLPDPSVSPVALLVAVVLALFGALAFLYVRADEAVAVEGEVGATDDEPVDLASIGRAAGAAADRIESRTDATNEVYRAWVEMVRHLHVPNPEATTPDEFERRAIEAGMEPGDVSELTRLFEEVRYGEYDPGEREERAVAALRRIERTYADGGEEA